MPERFNEEDLLRRNPRVDPDLLAEGRDLLRRLREQGLRRKEYDLVPPFGGHRVSIQDDAPVEPRLVQHRRAYGGE